MSHLTQEQKYKIEFYLQNNFSKAEIARLLNCPKKTINQEIKRNSNTRNGIYKADLAQQKYDNRLKEKTKKIRFTKLSKKK